MAELSWPTAAGGSVTEARYEYLMGGATPDGLIGLPTLSKLVFADSTGRHVKIQKARYAVVRGFIWASGQSVITLPVTANSSGKTRIDRVVLRLDRSNWSVRARVIAGTPATTPVAPAYQTTYPPGLYWDLPIATVTVPSGSTGIDDGAVVHTGWYLTEAPTSGTTPATPPHVVGRIFRNISRKRTYIAVETGWKTLQYDTGWLNLKLPSGWEGTMKTRQKNGWGVLALAIKRTGAEIAKSKDVTLYTLAESYRPPLPIRQASVITDPDHASYVTVLTTGKVILRADDSHVIKKNAYVYATVTWPLDD